MGLLILGLMGLMFEDRPEPVAMVLRAGKEATVQRGSAGPKVLREMDLLKQGDQVVSGKDGVTLVMLNSGQSERLAPDKKASVGKNGCLPKGVSEVLKRKIRKTNLDGLRDLAASSRGGIGVIRRGVEEAPPLGITPPHTTTVISDRPSFSWPAVKGAVRYEVQLFCCGERKPLWTESTTQTSLKYPEKQKALADGMMYRWQVKAVLKDGSTHMAVKEAELTVLEASLRPALESLQTLAKSRDPDDRLLAAAIYEAHGVLHRALPLYENLAKERPDLGNVQRALATYYQRLGMKEKAAAARKQAEKAGVEVADR